MAQKAKSSSSSVSKMLYCCDDCQQEFSASSKNPLCPNCNSTDLTLLEKDTGIPVEDINRAIRGSSGVVEIPVYAPPHSGSSMSDAEADLLAANMANAEYHNTIRDQRLEKAKAKLLEEETHRLEKEIRLQQVKKSFEAYKDGGIPVLPSQSPGHSNESQMWTSVPYNPNAQTFLANLRKMGDEERELFINMLNENPGLAYTFSSMMNPQTGHPQPPGQIPPFGIQQSAPAPTGPSVEDITSSVMHMTSTLMNMIPKPASDDGRMQELKEELQQMRADNKELQKSLFTLQLSAIEKKHEKQESSLNADAIRGIIKEVISSSTPQNDRMDVKDLLSELKQQRDLMIDMGMVSDPSLQASSAESVQDFIKKHEFVWNKEKEQRNLELEEKKLQKEIMMRKSAMELISAGMRNALRSDSDDDVSSVSDALGIVNEVSGAVSSQSDLIPTRPVRVRRVRPMEDKSKRHYL